MTTRAPVVFKISVILILGFDMSLFGIIRIIHLAKRNSLCIRKIIMVEWLPVSRTCLLRNSHGNLATLALTYSAHIQYRKKDKINSLRLWLSFFWRSFCSARRSSSERGSSCFSFSYKQFQIRSDYIDPKYADIRWRWSWLNDLDWETLETWGGLWGELVEKVQEGAGVHLPRHHVHVVVLHHLQESQH